MTLAGFENNPKNSINPAPVKNMTHKKIIITLVILAPAIPNAHIIGTPIAAPKSPEL